MSGDSSGEDRTLMRGLASPRFGPSRLAWLVLIVGVIGTVGSWVGARYWSLVPASSFGNVGEWVAGAASVAALLAVAHELALERQRQDLERRSNLERALVRGFEIEADPETLIEWASSDGVDVSRRADAWESAVRRWATDVMAACDRVDHAALFECATELSRLRAVVEPYAEFRPVPWMIEFLRRQEGGLDLEQQDRVSEWESMAQALRLAPARARLVQAIQLPAAVEVRAAELAQRMQSAFLPPAIGAVVDVAAREVGSDSERYRRVETALLHALRIPPELRSTSDEHFVDALFVIDGRRWRLGEVFG